MAIPGKSSKRRFEAATARYPDITKYPRWITTGSFLQINIKGLFATASRSTNVPDPARRNW